ncbi:MAG: class I SAM-dependent methyltransferase [Mariniblastus sp.]
MPDKPMAYEAYQLLADSYAKLIDTKPHNAYYDRPAVLSLLPELEGKHVFDVGCGPGAYTEELAKRGATVVACDVSERMLELAQERLSENAASELEDGKIELKLIDLTKPLDVFADAQFDLINAPLCLDYIADWRVLFAEFFRILKPSGTLLFSCAHPSFDAEYFKTKNYFSVEAVQSVWSGFGVKVRMPTYRRSLEEMLAPLIETGFVIEKVHEPLPTEDFKKADLRRYKRLMHRPSFICVRSRRA